MSQPDLPTSPASAKSEPPAHWIDAWHTSPSQSKEYDAVDGLRGMAIILVVVSHLIYVNPSAGPLAQFLYGVANAGGFGVTIFFALSGFLISLPFWKRKLQASEHLVPPGYARRRFWKIYPPLALSVLLLTPVYLYLKGDAAAYLTVAGQWLVGWPILHPVSSRINPATWSLIVEIHFYLLIPFLFLATKRFSARQCLVVFALVLGVVPMAFRWWNLAHGVTFTLHPEIQVHFPSLLDAFAFGVLAGGLESLGLVRKTWARLGDLGVLLLAGAMLAAAWLRLHPPAFVPVVWGELLGLLVKVAAALLLTYAFDSTHPRACWFAQPWLRWCGLVSYEWYLFHQPIGFWIRDDLLGPAGGDRLKYATIVGGAFVIGLLIAALVYRYFSLPILRWGRQRRGPN